MGGWGEPQEEMGGPALLHWRATQGGKAVGMGLYLAMWSWAYLVFAAVWKVGAEGGNQVPS